MKKQYRVLARVLVILLVYFLLRYKGGETGEQILYPVVLFVTFLHEFGHALAAILTGGYVDAIQINPNGSGFTRTAGGNAGIILMGGYIGSAIFGNLLFYIGVRKPKVAPKLLNFLGVLMGLSALFWFNSVTSTVILLLFAAGIYLITRFTPWENEVLMFFGLASVLYIIQDFDVGPSSDLRQYAIQLGLFSADVWKYIWLGVVILISAANIQLIFRGAKR